MASSKRRRNKPAYPGNGMEARVTASGGVSSLDDVRLLQGAKPCGIDSVIIGKAIYEGRIKLQDALKV